MKNEKRFIAHIKKSASGFFNINNKKLRIPVKIIILESQLPLFESKIRFYSVSDYDIELIKNDNNEETMII